MTLYEMIEAVREAYWKKERQAYSVLFDEAKRAAFDVPVARFFKKQRYVLICCEVEMGELPPPKLRASERAHEHALGVDFLA